MARIALLAAVTMATCACASASVPHRVADRDAVIATSVRFEHLPRASRLVLLGAAAGERRVLASGVEGDVVLPFTFQRREHVDNGVVAPSRPPAPLQVSVQAVGYFPRVLAVPLSPTATTVVDARMAPVAVPPLVPEKWDPTSIGLPREAAGHPTDVVLRLHAGLLAAKDPAGDAGLLALAALASKGDLAAAIRVATLVAAPLAPQAATLALHLPNALLADARLHEAYGAVRAGHTAAAEKLLAEANRIDPAVEPDLQAWVHKARAGSMQHRAEAAQRAGDSVTARAFWSAVATLVPSSREARAGLAATEASALDAFRVRLALKPLERSDVGDRLAALLRAGLPRHVSIVPLGENPNAVLSYAVSQPVRSFHASTTTRTKDVVVGTVSKPNPEYEDAQRELQEAADALPDAQRQYEEFHEKANEIRQQASSAGGLQGLALVPVAASSEAAGVAILTDAKSNLSKAREKLKTTPRTIAETVHRDASYPVLLLDATSKVRLAFRLDGMAELIQDSAESETKTTAERVDAAPSIGVTAVRPDANALAALAPDLDGSLRAVADRIAKRVQAVELASAWTAFASLSQGSDVPRAANAAVGYLLIAGDGAPHRQEVAEYLVRNLP